MKVTAELRSAPSAGIQRNALERLQQTIDHAAHFLPQQGPLSVFVHHNTLHAFEDLPFEVGVLRGLEAFGAEPYLSEVDYREHVASGRIRQEDLAAVLLDVLGDDADQLLGFMGTRFYLRMAMLRHPLPQGTDGEIRWLLAGSDALRRFRPETPPDTRQQMIEATRRWVIRDLGGSDPRSAELRKTLLPDGRQLAGCEKWRDSVWEAFTLELLWRVCENGVRTVPIETLKPAIRHRDLLKQVSGIDIDELIHPLLIRFTAAYLDQGFAHWRLPNREAGYLPAFVALYRDHRSPEPWMRNLRSELQRIEQEELSALECVAEALEELGVDDSEQEAFIGETLLALGGWAGMIRQMERAASWAVHPAAKGALTQFLAVRLLLERLALRHALRTFDPEARLATMRSRLQAQLSPRPKASTLQRTYTIFQLAQVRGWTPQDLQRIRPSDWRRLVDEIESFSSLERRRVYQAAYERCFHHHTLDAILAHLPRSPYANPPDASRTPAFQVVCCLDEREESFRRHLEEVDPECETFGAAGFYGVAMYYCGATEAHYRPLCPIVVTPKHYVREEPVYTFVESSKRLAKVRKGLGRLAHSVDLGSRTLVGGVLTTLAGSLATVPLLTSVLFPWLTSRVLFQFGRIVTPPLTRLRIERFSDSPGPEDRQVGYTISEMADIVEAVLHSFGLTRNFSPLVIITGHGSSSLNNPHAAAYDCGACGGGRGGPNARAFSSMANDHRVRRLLAERGMPIPDSVHFLAAFHNTCDDSVTFFDMDRLPPSHLDILHRARTAIDEARRRNAHERCRRFESAPLSLSPEAALRHVENRAADLSQTRPECGHATNALCFVGRRSWSRGLFLDRRCFLTSYDSSQDDEQATTLKAVLAAAIPVCAGITLEYYFSRVDPRRYGCGTKLPHNVASLLGVMNGASSDLMPGLPWQMVDIHEPMRLLFVIETTPEAMLRVMAENDSVRRLVENSWVFLATIDPDRRSIHVYHRGRFEPYQPETDQLPTVDTSAAWYRGQRDHLRFATIAASLQSACDSPREAG